MSAAPSSRSAASLTVKGAATRDRIIDAAVDLIGLHGVAGTSTEQVRTRAEVSGSQLYHYFDSKQALVQAVIVRQADAAIADFRLDQGALDDFDALRAWVGATLERQAADEHRCTLPTLAGEASSAGPAAKQTLIDAYARWRRSLAAGLEQMRTRGVLRDSTDVGYLADTFIAALHGGSQLANLLGDIDPMRAALDAALYYADSFRA